MHLCVCYVYVYVHKDSLFKSVKTVVLYDHIFNDDLSKVYHTPNPVSWSLPCRRAICCFLSSASTVTFPSFLCLFACGCTSFLACFPPSGSCTPPFDDFTVAASEGSGTESVFVGSFACKQFALRIPGHRGVRKNDFPYTLVVYQLKNCKLLQSQEKFLQKRSACTPIPAVGRFTCWRDVLEQLIDSFPLLLFTAELSTH